MVNGNIGLLLLLSWLFHHLALSFHLCVLIDRTNERNITNLHAYTHTHIHMIRIQANPWISTNYPIMKKIIMKKKKKCKRATYVVFCIIFTNRFTFFPFNLIYFNFSSYFLRIIPNGITLLYMVHNFFFLLSFCQ